MNWCTGQRSFCVKLLKLWSNFLLQHLRWHLPWLSPFLAQYLLLDLLTWLWARQKFVIQPRSARKPLRVHGGKPTTGTHRGYFHCCQEPEEHRDLWAADTESSGAAKGGTGTLRLCSHSVGRDRPARANQQTPCTSKQRLWHHSLNFSCSITFPLNPNHVWYICLLETGSLCPQTAGQPLLSEQADGPSACTAWPIQWHSVYLPYCLQDSICYIKNKEETTCKTINKTKLIFSAPGISAR